MIRKFKTQNEMSEFQNNHQKGLSHGDLQKDVPAGLLRRHRNEVWLAAALLLVCLMPSSQSLWIDEGFMVPYASSQTFSDFISRLTDENRSEALMPLGVFSTWVGARLFGQSELGLRMMSALWAAMAVFLMWRIGVHVGMPWLSMVFACHPFLWHYGGEARPYTMVIAMAAGVLYALAAAKIPAGGESKGLTALLIFGPLLCATHILGVVPFGAVTVFVTLTVTGDRRLTRGEWVGVSLSAAMVALVGAYYLWTLARGAQTTAVSPWTFNVGSLLFSGYELMGFAGFGPGRYELRQLALEGGIGNALGGMARPWSIGAIGLLVLYGYLFIRLLIHLRSRGSSSVFHAVLSAGFVVAVTVLATLAMFFVAGNTFWGRHLAAVLPFLVFLVVMAAKSVVVGPIIGRVNLITVLVMGLLLASSLMLRFHPEHGRDDYRYAAHQTLVAVGNGLNVWWAADPKVARYYGVSFSSKEPVAHSSSVAFVANGKPERLSALPEPDIVILSKPDLFDRSANVQRYIDSHGFRLDEEFIAFRIYRRVENS